MKICSTGNVSRYQIGSVLKGEKPGRMLETISEMNDSFAVNVAYHCDDPKIGMALTQDLGKYKMYVADTGIFVTLAFWDKKFTENVIYSKLLGDKLSVNLGYVFEKNAAIDIAPVAAFYFSVDYTQLPHPFVVVTRSIVIDIFAIIY